ncbi:MAG TPA: MBL fold metallo-hydrolase, partial [Bacteroidetes bacterium]|nr:MBL fold metallo-hydrolase [Bacteroidota bacterium]
MDTGCGGKWEEKQRDMFHIEEPRLMITDLARCDVHAEEVTHVILSHLHFDHAGGGTFIDKDGGLKVQFPNARYFIQRGEWEIARHPNPRDRASYLPENLDPLEEAGAIEFLEGDGEVLPGIR